MSVNKRIKLDDNNKLVIENDNAVIASEGTTSTIEGVYEISYEDVEKLLVLINDKTILKNIKIYGFLGNAYISGTRIISGDEAINESLSVVSKEYDELNKEHIELENKYRIINDKYDNLLRKVKSHNATSLFNKIKID